MLPSEGWGTRKKHENKQKVLQEGKKVFVVKQLKNNTALRSGHRFYEPLCDSARLCSVAALAGFLVSCFPHCALILAGNKLYLRTKGLFSSSNKNDNCCLTHCNAPLLPSTPL